MSFPTYPKYKDSGVGWLGEVPDHWTLTTLKRLALLNPRKSGFDGDTDQLCTFVPMEKLKTGVVQIDEERPIQEVIGGYTYFEDGDVLQAKVTPCFENKNIAIAKGLTNGIGFGSSEINVFRPYQSVGAGFLYYRVQEDSYMRFCTSNMIGAGGLKRVPTDVINNFKIGAPELFEQNQIACFLDHETARIDALIDEQQRLIELLKEKRQAVISHAVTKGLDPTVPMKDSGVEWLGEVPAHWNFGKVRYFAKLESGHTPSRSKSEYWENCTVPWFSLADVWQIRSGAVIELSETKELISELGLANSSARLLPKGTVILSRTASVGYSAIMGCDMATTQDFANWICGDKLNNKFLLYSFRAMKSEFSRLMVGSTHKTIYMPDIAELVCSAPPLAEQEEIASHIESMSFKFEKMIEEAERIKRLLIERRSALISAAVTGKIDVRGWKPPASSKVQELEEETM